MTSILTGRKLFALVLALAVGAPGIAAAKKATITGVGLVSQVDIAVGAPVGTPIGDVMVSMAEGEFRGTLRSYTNQEACTLSSPKLPSKLLTGKPVTVAGEHACTISATQAGATGSPYVQTIIFNVKAAEPPPPPPPAVEPTISLVADPPAILAGAQTILSWVADNAMSCNASDGWSGAKAVSGSEAFTPASTTKYTLSCVNGEKYATASITVDVSQPPPPPPPPVLPPSLVFDVQPSIVLLGQPVTATWGGNNLVGCMSSWGGEKLPGGNEALSLTADTTLSMTCTGLDGTTVSAEKAVTVTQPPPPPEPTTACLPGNAIPTPAALVLPPTVPQPQAAGDVVGVIVQNTGTDSPSFATFGQVFVRGAVAPAEGLLARVGSTNYPAQVDVQALHEDGSVRMASVTVPSACAGTQVPMMLLKAAPPTSPPLDVGPVQLSVDLACTQGCTSQTIDLGAALAAAQPDYWLRGPLATQTRVDVPVAGSPEMHLTADVTRYQDGRVAADLQFNRDLTKIIRPTDTVAWAARLTPLPPLVYTATTKLGGKTAVRNIQAHYQYQDWIERLGDAPALNVQHDVPRLIKTGAVLPYDLKTGVNNTSILQMAQMGSQTGPYGTANNPPPGEPLSANGVMKGMGTTGGRSDIGPTTRWATTWIVTQDARMDRVVRLQGDTFGAIPWNFKNAANGRWATVADDVNIYTGPGSSVTIANPMDTKGTGWGPDNSHEPNLAYVPYLMTGQRWYYDRMFASAAKVGINDWPYYRCGMTFGKNCGVPGYSALVTSFTPYVRGEAWSLREVQLFAFMAKQGSWEREYFNKVIDDNWKFVALQYPDVGLNGVGRLSVALEGELKGYSSGPQSPPASPGTSWAYKLPNGDLQTAAFMHDYWSNAIVWGALLGHQGAKDFIAWQKDGWLTGRYIPQPGWKPVNAAQIALPTWSVATQQPVKTWAEVQASLVANGVDRPEGWPITGSAAGYIDYSRAGIAGALHLFPGNARLTEALNWIDTHVNLVALHRDDPTWNVAPP